MKTVLIPLIILISLVVVSCNNSASIEKKVGVDTIPVLTKDSFIKVEIDTTQQEQKDMQAQINWALELETKVKEGYQPSAEEINKYNQNFEKIQLQ